MYLGVYIETVYDAVQEGMIPHIRLGRKIFFSKEEIDTWIREQEKLS